MSQCRFLNCNKCAILVESVGKGGGYACVVIESFGGISTSFAQFCCQSRTALKILLKLIHFKKLVGTWMTFVILVAELGRLFRSNWVR